MRIEKSRMTATCARLGGTGIVLLLAGGSAGCLQQNWADIQALTESATTDGGSTTTSAGDEPSTPSGPSTTVTTMPPDPDSIGDSETASTSTTGEPSTSTADPSEGPEDNAPPYIHWFLADKEKISKAGPLTFKALFSEDVSAIDLYLDGELLAILGPADFPYTHVVTGAEQNGQGREFWIRVRDLEGLEATSMPAIVDIELPESGSAVWKLIGDDPQWAEGRTIVPHKEGVVVGGYLVEDGYSTPILRRYDENKFLSWTIAPISGIGAVAGLAVTPEGHLVAVGVADKGGLRPWIVGFDEYGNTVFGPSYGQLKETPTGVAVAEDGSIYVSGYVQTLDEGKFDAMLWAYNAAGGPKWFVQWDNPVEGDKEDPGWSRDQAHGVAVLSDGSIAIAGETWVKDEVYQYLPNTRAFVRRHTPGNALLGSWIASKYPAKHSAALAIAADFGGGVLIGGWRSYTPNSTTTPLVVALDQSIAPVWYREEETPESGIEAVRGVARLPAGQVVLAMTVEGQGGSDLLVRGVADEFFAGWEYLHTPTTADDRLHGWAMGEHGAMFYVGASGQSVIIAGEVAP